MKRLLFLCISLVILLAMLSISSIRDTATGTAPMSYIVNPFSSPDWIGEPNYVGVNFGAAVASAGDVNGDGYDDVIIGAPYYTNGQVNEGRGYLYYGSASGLAISPAWTYENNIEGCELGHKASSAGDVNGDGYDDVMLASEYCTTTGLTGHREGIAYLFYGSAAGLPATYSWMKVGDTHAEESLGWSIASAGDVNNDGYDDVIIGAPWATSAHHGKVYAFYGSSTGLAAIPNWEKEGNMDWADFGAWVDSAGDVNGDGFDDVIIGHPGWSSPDSKEGRAYVYYGSSTGLAATYTWTFENNHENSELGATVAGAGDVNGDGYGDVLVGARMYANPDAYEGIGYLFLGSLTGLASTPAWSQEGNQPYGQFSWSLDSGDYNHDGYADVIVGAPFYDDGEQNEGLAFLYFGSPTGLLPTPIFSIGSNQAGATLGWAIASAGDVNGDGIDDIILGARNYSGGQGGEGRATVYHGIVNAAARLLLPVILR